MKILHLSGGVYLKKAFSSFLKLLPVIIFWLLVWEAAAFIIGASIILVSPRETFARLFAMAFTANFWNTIGLSMNRIMRGFLLALITSVTLAALSSKFKLIHRLFLPLINVINAIPIASFTIIALMAMSSANLPVFVVFVTVTPIIFHSTHKGIAATDAKLLEMADLFRVPLWKKVLFIYVKWLAPFVVSAAAAGIGFAWKSGVAAEVIGLVRGSIGGSLHQARIFLQTADLFAWTVAIIVLSYCMEKLLRMIFGRVMKWQ